jgi:hypothetical protein
MARRESPAQRETVARVMHEFKHGELPAGQGGKVRNPKQAIAIALSEAGASNRQSPAENRKRLRETKRKERAGQTAQAEAEGRRPRREGDARTRKELYAEAARRGVSGRSRMSKDELVRALHR